ncbi:MAG: alginate lyase family protein, partial [Prevotella sp.]|nr:alginate lyase family protein [Prevotella sp.]
MRLILLMQFVMCLATAGAQSLWDPSHLAYAKAHAQQPMLAAAISRLVGDADQALLAAAPSVMQKQTTAVSGDRHDYTSLSRYFWPDPTKPDGLPYVNRDGLSNPELDKYDRNRLSEMTSAVTTLSLAWYFTDREAYAQKATELLRTWFLNRATRMNPHLRYAQMVPGVNGGRGRCYGLIDSYSFVEMLSAVKLLEQSKAFTRRDAQQLKAWFAQLLQWMLTSEQGIEESRQANNHSVAYDVQLLSYALYTDNQQVARQLTDSFPSRRLQQQIAPDGSQPHELWRTLAFGYSEYNLQHCIDFCQLARQASTMPTLATLEKAADYLAQYLGKDVQAWPHQQISDWEGKQQELCRDLYRLWLLDGQREDYRRLVDKHLVKQFADRFFLLYYRPTVADQAFAAADVQLRFQMEQVRTARTKTPGTMPR